jgi:hypothetical protein
LDIQIASLRLLRVVSMLLASVRTTSERYWLPRKSVPSSATAASRRNLKECAAVSVSAPPTVVRTLVYEPTSGFGVV